MRKINEIDYEVRSGEEITIEVTPRNFLNNLPSVQTVLDKNKLPNSGTVDTPKFEFKVTKPFNDTHNVIMEFRFFDGTPSNACYDVAISGENDEGCPCGLQVCKVDQTREVAIGFDVLLPEN
jgi:hypothetical protein